MIGMTGASILLAINVIIAGLIGVAAGRVTCLALRLPWVLTTGVVDGVLAAGVAVVAAYVVSAVESARGVWTSRVALVFAIAAVFIAVRHLFRFGWRPLQ